MIIIFVYYQVMLVLTTMFVSVNDSLPRTSYIKMVDIWLIFAQLIPFFEVILHTFMDMLDVTNHTPFISHGCGSRMENPGTLI